MKAACGVSNLRIHVWYRSIKKHQSDTNCLDIFLTGKWRIVLNKNCVFRRTQFKYGKHPHIAEVCVTFIRRRRNLLKVIGVQWIHILEGK